MTAPTLVLGSGSAYRAALLERLGLTFTCRTPAVDESRRESEPPSDYVLRLAVAKARAAADGLDDVLVIGADQIACIDDALLGKPGGREAAIAQLQRVSGRRVCFLVGLALHDTRANATATRLERLDAHFRTLSRDEIVRYVDTEKAFDCAGSFRAEGLGISLLRRLEGDDPNTLIGLPLIALSGLLRDAGIPLP